MNRYHLLFAFVLASCSGSLNDEQRQRMKENMELNRIKKFSDSQIVEEAYRQGRLVALVLEKRDPLMGNAMLIDSLETKFGVEIVAMQPNDSLLRAVEQKIIEAYMAGGATTLSDNIQKSGSDSLLYTKPLMTTHADGSVAFSKALGVRMLRKNVILSIKD